jgi:hypothetical protein
LRVNKKLSRRGKMENESGSGILSIDHILGELSEIQS